MADGGVLKKAAIIISTKVPAKTPKKGKTGGANKKSIPPRAKQTAKLRSVLRVDKYGPDQSSKWKRVNARFIALYKALLTELDKANFCVFSGEGAHHCCCGVGFAITRGIVYCCQHHPHIAASSDCWRS